MTREILTVQFTHPGGEHTVSRKEKVTGIKEWNYGPHRRKYLKALGQYMTNDGSLSPKQELLFWGEWEPTSRFGLVASSVATGVVPKYYHEPFLCVRAGSLVVPPFYNGKFVTGKNGNKEPLKRQNTDPFVFGDCFLYSCCKQRRCMKKSSVTQFTKMGDLDRGSLILFGSTISPKQGGPYFVLDTVFVVADYNEYYSGTAQKDLAGIVPKDYYEIMGFKGWSPHNNFILYRGATVAKPVNGMFSFVPCKPCASGNVGFPRVKLTSSDIPSVISDNLNASPKFSGDSVILPKNCWNQVCAIVKKQGFEMGVNFEYEYRTR